MDMSEEPSFFDYFLNGLQDPPQWRDLDSSSSEISSPPSSSPSTHASPPQPGMPDLPFSSQATITPPPPLFENNISVVKEETLVFPISSPNGVLPTSPNRKRPISGAKDETLNMLTKTYIQNPGLQEDEKHLKRQRRLIKNRESAQLSRLRKKIYIEELERKVNHLVAQNELLTQQVQTISGDKKKLTDEVLYLQSLIKQTPHFGNAAAIDASSIMRRPAPSANLKAAGVCLLMVLFSFGLLFNATSHNTPPQRSLPWTNNRREEFPGFFFPILY